MSRNVRKRTFWDVHPTKTQISLRIRSLISFFAVRVRNRCILAFPKCAQLRFWSDCTNAESSLGAQIRTCVFWRYWSYNIICDFRCNKMLTFRWPDTRKICWVLSIFGSPVDRKTLRAYMNGEVPDQFTQSCTGSRPFLLTCIFNKVPIMWRRTAKILTRLRGCTGWSGSALFVYVLRSLFLATGHFIKYVCYPIKR